MTMGVRPEETFPAVYEYERPAKNSTGCRWRRARVVLRSGRHQRGAVHHRHDDRRYDRHPDDHATGATATSYLVSYTRGSNWAVDTEYTVGVTAQDVYSRQLTESYTFRTAARIPEALAVTTTTLANGKVGVPFIPPDLAATGGVSPYTWITDGTSRRVDDPVKRYRDVGRATATFSGTITIRATDSATPTPATDNQDISFTVDAADIPGYPTIEIGTVPTPLWGLEARRTSQPATSCTSTLGRLR